MDHKIDALPDTRSGSNDLLEKQEKPRWYEITRSRLGLSLILVLPLMLVFAITFGGYLYFNYQTIRTAIAEREFDSLSRVAQLMREEFNAVRFDIITLLLDPAIRNVQPGGNTAFDSGILQSVMSNSERYEFIALLDPSGNEISRAGSTDPTTPALPDNTSISHSETAYFQQAIEQRDQQVFGATIGLAIPSAGDLLRQARIYFVIPLLDQNNDVQSVLLLVHRASRLLGSIAELASSPLSDLWLINGDGQILASQVGERPFSFIANTAARNTLQDQQPEIWSVLSRGVDRFASFESGLLTRAKVCGQTNCLSSSGQLALTPSSDAGMQLDGWNLVTLIPDEYLAPLTLITAQNNRWFPLTLLILLAGVVASACAWFLASTMAALHRNEARLKRANMLQDAFFEKNPEIMFVKNLDGSYFLANEKCRELAGMPDKDFSGVDRSDVFPSMASSTMADQDKQVIARAIAMEFHTNWKRDGVMHYFKTLRFPIFNQQREIVAVGGIANDVTEQVQSRHALMENEELLRTFIESAPEAVLICDADAAITLVNKEAELIFGFDRSNMMEKSLFTLLPGLSRQQFEDTLKRDGSSIEILEHEILEGQGVASYNRKFPAEFSLAPIITSDGALMICMLRDVSDKVMIETQLRQSQKMEAIGKLTGGMAHDFNNLLGIIIGNIALGLRQVKGDQRLEKRLETALMAANRGAELTKRMLAIARRQPLQPKPVSINSVIKELAQMLPQTLGSDIEMILDLDDNLPLILLDESGFEALLLNLSINSRDAMPDGGTFTVQTSVKAKKDIQAALPHTIIRDSVYIHIAVSDTGTGMTPEALSRAFEPFFTTKEKGKGTGLGLAMIYGFVKQSYGYIVLDSSEGEGTTVHIYLPVDNDIGPMEAEPKPVLGDTSIDGKSFTVLVVDDEEELLSIAEAYLQDIGLHVLIAHSGIEALQVLDKNPDIDLLVTDVVMPGGISGPALAAKIRQKLPSVKILYASGFPSGVLEESAGTMLDAPLINKPYTRELLVSEVIKTLRPEG